VGVSPGVAVQPVTHVDQLLGHDEFHRPWLILIDTFEVNQDGVIAGPAHTAVRSAIRRRHGSSNPRPVGSAARRHSLMIDREIEQHTIVIDELAQSRVALIENQDRFTSGLTG